jgi:hypothetical protein
MTSIAGTPYYIGKGTGGRAFVKHGRTPVPAKEYIVFLKENISESEAHDYEIELIAKYGRKDLGEGILNNQTNGGEGISDPSLLTRQRMAEAKRNESVETRQKRSIAAKNRVRTPISEETKKKISAANTGKIRSEEAKAKMSEKAIGRPSAKKGKPLSDEVKQKMSIAAKNRSPEAAARIAEANKNKNLKRKPNA